MPSHGKRGVGRSDDRRRGELRDRDVIGMSVGAVRSERHDDVGLDPPQVSDNGRDRLARVRAVEMLIAIVEQRDFAHTQHRGGGAQLRLTDVRQRQRAGMLMIVRDDGRGKRPLSPRVAVSRKRRRLRTRISQACRRPPAIRHRDARARPSISESA